MNPYPFRSLVWMLFLVLSWAGTAFAADEAAPAFKRSFVQKDGFAATLLASRERHQQANSVYAAGYWHISSWPSRDMAAVNPPEEGEKVLDKKNKFRRTRAPAFHAPNTKLIYTNQTTYLYREFECISDGCEVKALINLDRGQMRVLFNGKKIAETDPKGLKAASVLPLKLPFKKGTNTLFIKLVGAHRRNFRFQTDFEPLDLAFADMKSAYSAETNLLQAYFREFTQWYVTPDSSELLKKHATVLVRKLQGFETVKADYAKISTLDPAREGAPFVDTIVRAAKILDGFADLKANWAYLYNPAALRRAIADLKRSYPKKYPADAFLARLDALGDLADLEAGIGKNREADLKRCEAYLELKREALLANPLIDFERIVLVKREQKGKSGFPQNYQGNSSMDPHLDDSIVTLRIKDDEPELETLYKPKKQVYCGDIDLHFDAEKLLFSSVGKSKNWHVYEIGMDGKGLRQVSQSDDDLDNYDAVYLPDGRIIYSCTSGYVGVPCVGGNDYVANLHIMDNDGANVRRLTFEQDNDWHPTMLPNGRVMYLRWEYTDSSHYFSRILMQMNPDGTNQVALYGSNSYWPNGIFYARPIPGSNSKFVGIVSGHHGVARYGQCVLFDGAKGRFEADGVVQAIPGYGKKVEPVVKDGLVGGYSPLSLSPYPLSEKYYLMSLKNKRNVTGLYLVDVFDNLLLIKEVPGYILYDAIPVRKTPRPPVIPDKVDPKSTEAIVYLQDVHFGEGLKGVPRGTVKKLRVYQYEYSYRNTGGHSAIGYEGPWDVRRLIGTVPLCDDGSAFFKIPANVPIAVQPLDAEGKALAIMRSWFVAMPGEVLSCVGCHERQNMSPVIRPVRASNQAPVRPRPFYGPKRGFSFVREVQPVLDKYCVGCHSGDTAKRKNIPDFSHNPEYPRGPKGVGRYSTSYHALHPFVRRNGPEGDYHLLRPLEFHADTSELIEILEKGHHGVKLNAEAWERLITWIDLNVPFYGTWNEATNLASSSRHQNAEKVSYVQRRYELKKLYARVDEDIEAVATDYTPLEFVKPAPVQRPAGVSELQGWPQVNASARPSGSTNARMEVDLGDGQRMTFVRIPAGSFIMGSGRGELDEAPTCVVKIEKPFWMSTKEITNAQYALFDPKHDSGVLDRWGKDQTDRGFFVNQPELPVIRVSWDRAREFCRWLGTKAGKTADLPTEAQWEWACRAGSDAPMNYGETGTVFSALENLADVTTKELPRHTTRCVPIPNPDPLQAFLLADHNSDDKALHQVAPGSYKPNRWGLYDMHGNVMEWTRSSYRPYPYRHDDGRNAETAVGKRVARGGSWRTRPKRATASYRRAYHPWQQVYSVGLRVIIEE